MNLLAGPLAEAKYVAPRDNELMPPRLIDLNALHFYGGSADLKVVDDYPVIRRPIHIRKQRKSTRCLWPHIVSSTIALTGRPSLDGRIIF
ncbi:MAG: hypothetical protein ACU841_04000 [Gammaproteobacteria bacterium]